MMNKRNHCCQLRKESMSGFNWSMWVGRAEGWTTGMIQPEKKSEKLHGHGPKN